MTLAHSRNPHRYAQLAAARAIVVHVGAPPATVELGLPGSIDEVRAYASRIDGAWRDFWETDVQPWAKKEIEVEDAPTSEESTMGEVLGEDKGAVEERRRLIKFYEKIQKSYQRFLSFKDEVNEPNVKLGLLGPRIGISPNQAWQELQVFEGELAKNREVFSEETGKPLKSKKPEVLELAGGVKQGVKESVGEAAEAAKEGAKAIGSLIPWTPIAIAAGLGLGAVLLLKSK